MGFQLYSQNFVKFGPRAGKTPITPPILITAVFQSMKIQLNAPTHTYGITFQIYSVTYLSGLVIYIFCFIEY